MMKATIFTKGAKAKTRRENKFSLRKMLYIVSFAPLFLFALSFPANAQNGGAFTIEKSVISSGGGTVSGGAITIESAVGQPSAGLSQNPQFILFGGFITPQFAPTAAAVSISGRAATASGAGIRNVIVTILFPNGERRTTQTGSFGAYLFEDIPVSETYIVTVTGKKYSFANPSQVVYVSGQISDLNFTATEP